MDHALLGLENLRSVATSYIREIGVPSSQYIDDRHLGELWGPIPGMCSSYQAALAGVVLAIAELTELGYFIDTEKSAALPNDSFSWDTWSTPFGKPFSIPEDKKQKFTTLRDAILLKRTVSLNTLKRFQGKYISLSLMVPAAKLLNCSKTAGLTPTWIIARFTTLRRIKDVATKLLTVFSNSYLRQL